MIKQFLQLYDTFSKQKRLICQNLYIDGFFLCTSIVPFFQFFIKELLLSVQHITALHIIVTVIYFLLNVGVLGGFGFAKKETFSFFSKVAMGGVVFMLFLLFLMEAYSNNLPAFWQEASLMYRVIPLFLFPGEVGLFARVLYERRKTRSLAKDTV